MEVEEEIAPLSNLLGRKLLIIGGPKFIFVIILRLNIDEDDSVKIIYF